MDVRTCRIVGLKGSGDNSVYFPTIQSRTLLDSFTNHLKRKMSMIPCYVRNQFAGNSDFEARSRGWEPSNICPPVKWTNNCNRAIVETLNEDFIPEFEDKIAGSGGREDAFIQCILRHGHGVGDEYVKNVGMEKFHTIWSQNWVWGCHRVTTVLLTCYIQHHLKLGYK